MNIPAPTTAGPRTSFALGAPFGRVNSAQWSRALESGAFPVVLHTLGMERERAEVGPRELREATVASLDRLGVRSEWGLGGVVRETDDAAQFATAGYTWFTFDLHSRVNLHAATMTLDELDAAIVALEGAGCFEPGWHQAYLDREFATNPPLRFSDEELARCAVAFGPALAHAGQLQQAIRACRSGHGGLPDIEVSLAGSRAATSALESLFITQELRRRDILASTFSPGLGIAWQPGTPATLNADEAGTTLASHRSACELARIPKFGVHFSAEKTELLTGLSIGHRDETGEAWLDALRVAVKEDPQLFRAWLAAASEAFPLARGGLPIALTDEEARALPEVADEQLAATFLDAPQGRQLLLVTLDEVRGTDAGPRLAALLARC